MNIILSTDEKYIEHCATTMMSIVANNTACNFYILTDHLSEDQVSILDKIAQFNNSKVFVCNVPSSYVEYLPMPKTNSLSHISLATYYRLFITEVLPSDVTKAIYLDCDIIIRHDLSELWDTDINEYPLGAVYQLADWNSHECNRLGYNYREGYFNAGVLLINVDYLRNNNALNLYQHFIAEEPEKIKFHDQDVLNKVFHGKVKHLSPRWNMLTTYFGPSIFKVQDSTMDKRTHHSYLKILCHEYSNPYVVHYASKPKAWEKGCTHKWKYEYFKYNHMIGFNVSETYKDFIYSSSIIFLKNILFSLMSISLR